jgi:endogenous inhibitor of DNA gyrase (YacG/DUF329 family)
MARLLCPTCRQEFDSATTPAMPFCSQRCRLIDLGRWFGEEFSMPIERNPELEEFRSDEHDDSERR